MGLDSVELLMEIEEYFGIDIPNAEAEKLYTVQSMVDLIAAHLNITNESTALRDKIFEKVIAINQAVGFTNQKVELSSFLSSCIPAHEKFDWVAFNESLGLSVPRPESGKPFGTKISEKLKNLFSWTPNYIWEDITCKQFATAICANNYLDLTTGTISKLNMKFISLL